MSPIYAPSLAQQQTVHLTGGVQDNTGTAIPSANETVADSVAAKSDANGDYFVPLLLPADDYQIRVQMTGSKEDLRQNVSLQVVQSAKIDFVLQNGAASESVTVTGIQPLLDTQTSVGQVITGQTVSDLPLNGRSTFRLIALTPGAARGARNFREHCVAQTRFVHISSGLFRAIRNDDEEAGICEECHGCAGGGISGKRNRSTWRCNASEAAKCALSVD